MNYFFNRNVVNNNHNNNGNRKKIIFNNMVNNKNYNNYNGYNNINNDYIDRAYPQYDNNVYSYNKPKSNKLWWILGLSFLVFLVVGSIVLFEVGHSVNDDSKSRTIMIYMVGSDLESKSKQGTYSISDIDESRVDLAHNNVLLMVGGSKKWHNFVNSNEIGIYVLTSSGFSKMESLSVKSMGDSDVLLEFLNYSYENYPAKKYDMIFWNHGLGAAGVEQDELTNDYLSIIDLDEAFGKSPFKDTKLELTLFYNCLEANLHIANIMSKYSDYMIGSEEVLYLSKVLNRLSFLGDITPVDDAYMIARRFIDQSDSVVNAYNSTHANSIDSTLSFLDLTKVNKLNNAVNKFISSINLESDYYKIANIRKNLFTYGRTRANEYDTVDLYEMVSAFIPISNDKNAAREVLDAINEVVLYNSAISNYSNGISVYFPYYGNDLAIGIHLASFKQLWNDNYYSFISNFYFTRTGFKRAGKSSDVNLNILKNDIRKTSDGIYITLDKEELEKYQTASIYLFEKVDDEYELLLESSNLKLEDNKLVFNDPNLLYINGEVYSFIRDYDEFVYGSLSDEEDELDTIFSIRFNGNLGEIVGTILDSGKYPLSGLVNYDDYDNISIGKLRYRLFENGNFDMNWMDSEKKYLVSIDKNNIDISLKKNGFKEYYALVEYHDLKNEVYYSKIGIIN